MIHLQAWDLRLCLLFHCKSLPSQPVTCRSALPTQIFVLGVRGIVYLHLKRAFLHPTPKVVSGDVPGCLMSQAADSDSLLPVKFRLVLSFPILLNVLSLLPMLLQKFPFSSSISLQKQLLIGFCLRTKAPSSLPKISAATASFVYTGTNIYLLTYNSPFLGSPMLTG